MDIVNVDYMGMVRALMQVKGATPASILAVTPVDMNKKNNPFFERVFKKQKSSVFINFDYEKAVNRKQIKEGKDGDFEASARKWGDHLPGTPVVFNAKSNEYYLQVGFLTKNQPKVEYLVDGVETDKAVFETFLKSKDSTKTKEHQGLDDEVVVRTFKVKNIHELSVGGKKYVRTDI